MYVLFLYNSGIIILVFLEFGSKINKVILLEFVDKVRGKLDFFLLFIFCIIIFKVYM